MKKILVLLSLISLANNNNNDYVLNELLQASNFKSDDFVINKNCENHEDFKGVLLYEHESTDLIFYVFNQTGFNLLDVDSCRISMNYNDNGYNHYDLSYLGNSLDKRFYKFKINDFTIDFEDPVRIYEISEFETKQERVFDGDNAIGVREIDYYYSSNISQSYSYNKDGYIVNNLKTITLDVNSGWFRCPGSKSTVEDDGIIQTDVFYIYFNMPKIYGDLVKIDMEWYESYLHYHRLNVDGSSNTYYEDCYNSKYIRKEVKNTDETILDENDNRFWNPNNWFVGGSKGYNLKNLQRFSLGDLSEINSDDNNYCLDNNTIDFLNNSLSDVNLLINYDPYIIRYDVKDFIRISEPFLGGSGPVTYEYKVFEMSDIDVITCTFNKEGTIYTLPVVSNTNNQKTDDNVVPNDDYLDLIKRIMITIFAIIVFVLLLPILPYIIKLIFWIIKLPFTLIKKLIETIKKKK